MINKPVIVGIALAGIAAAAVGTYSYNRIQQQKSLRQGIAQTEQALRQVDALVEENQTELIKLSTRLKIDSAADFEKQSQEGLNPAQLQTPLGDTIDLFKIGANGFEGATAFQKGDYLKAVGQAAEAIAAVWGRYDKRVEYGTKAIDVAADLYEAYTLLVQQAHLAQVQSTLQQQLSRLQGKDPEAQRDWQQILNNLYGDPAVTHEAFLKWLAAQGLSENDVRTKALANANSAGPAIASQVASGVMIVDPSLNVDTIAGMPEINPDFVAAMQAEQYISAHVQSDPRWLRFTVSQYPDGTYIPAFGPCRGIDIPNPIYGGLISSSTAACNRAETASPVGAPECDRTFPKPTKSDLPPIFSPGIMRLSPVVVRPTCRS